MSNTKVKRISICFLLLLCSMFLFACDNNTPVEDIHFADESIVLLIGDTYSPSVNITPSYATNKNYTITSENSSIVSVQDNVLTALQEGEAVIRVVSEDNSLREDVMTVSVRKSVTTLQTPRINYNSANQTINFDMIANASSYTLRINGSDVNIGNSTSYSLSDYNNISSSAFDRVLTISVRANAPSYSHAFNSSNFSASLRIYQASSVTNASLVGGILSYDNNSSDVQISLDGNVILATSSNSVDLTNVDTNKSGYLDLTITKLVSESNKTDSSVTYYNSLPVSLRVKVMDEVSAVMVENTVSWQSNAEVESYKVYINNGLKLNTTNNFLDLTTLDDYNEILYSPTDHTLTVEPVINRASVNVIKTINSIDTINFNRLETPNPTAENNLISWNAVAGASSYVVGLKFNDYSTNIIVQNNSFSLDNYPSDKTYNVSVMAVPSYNENNLSSFVGSIEITKQGIASLSIDNYILSFPSTNLDSYLIEFNHTSGEYSETIVANSDNYTLDLSDFEFNAGDNTIYVTHLGNNLEIFDSAKVSIDFVQLIDEQAIDISNGVISVERNEINENALYRFEINGTDTEFTIESLTYELNTTSEAGENFLPAGEYNVSLYILGDGKNTFSVNHNGLSNVSVSFEVLDVPVLSLENKTDTILSISQIENAENYVVYKQNGVNFETFAEIDTNSCEFDIGSEILVFRTQAIGNGSTTINSNYSESINVQKLVSPTLTYNRNSDVVSITDPNNSDIVKDYVLTVNGEPKNYDFTNEYSDFVVGDNEFVVYIEAIDPSENNFYLNSDSFTLNINKIDGEAEFNINQQGQLIITPINQDVMHNLILSITINDEELLFESSGTALVSEDYTLNYEYIDGQYFVNLLDEKFEPVISSLVDETSFSVKVKFVPIESTTSVDSSFSDEKVVQIETATILGRFNQNLTIKINEVTDNYQNYSLIVNDSVVIELDSSAIVDSENGYILVDVGYIYSFLDDANGVLKINAITKNVNSTSESLRLSKKGESAYISRANQLTLTSVKDNNSTNNSVIISFNIDQEEYDKTYLISIFNLLGAEKTNEITIQFSNDDAMDGVISFNLDDISINGEIFVSVTTLTTDDKIEEDNTILMFNSLESERLEINKIDAVTNIYVSNGILHFDAVENAIGYEIYRVNSSVYEKLNVGLLSETSYGLTSLTGEANIVIKAIADLNYSNSSYSESIRVNKLTTPILSIVNGEMNLTLSSTAITLLQDEGVDIKIQATNGLTSFDFELLNEGISVDNNNVIILTDALNNAGVMSFGVNAPLNENLTFRLVVNYTSLDVDEEVYYINSNSSSLDVYGLLKASNLKKNSTENDYDEYVESITFEPSANNTINSNSNLVSGYTFRIIIGENTYYSTDANLKYRQISSVQDGVIEYVYLSYPLVLTATNFIFPYGYDSNLDGTISDDEVFKEGDYSISVKTMANVIGGYNLLNSVYSDPIEFSILKTPSLNVSTGSIVWEESADCTYIVRIYDSLGEDKKLLEIDSLTTNSFDFSNSIFDDYFGLYAVSVQTISTNSLVVNSRESELKLVYRMPKVVDAKVDDGYLVLSANAYFSSAEITFVDTLDSTLSQTITYSRSNNADEKLSELEVASWADFNTENITDLYANSNFIVLNVEGGILTLTQNRSYTINVKLIGNTNNDLGIINSAVVYNAGELTATKLSTIITEVEKGVFKFDSIDEYKTLNLNYNFNNAVTTDNNTFLNSTRVFKINLSTAGVTHQIYAVDYYSFMSAIENSLILADEYELVENRENLYAVYKYSLDGTNYLYFNVFNENTINLRDYSYIYYYQITNTLTESESLFESSSSISFVTLSDGGTFTINISLLGGDSIIEENTTRTSHTAYLSSDAYNMPTFVRYGTNNLTTYNGQVMIQNMQVQVDGQVIDYPIYKLGVNVLNDSENVEYVYLYHSDIMTEDEAKSVTGDSEAIYVAIIFSDTQNVLFNFADYFEAGSYQINVQTLAGLGALDSEEANYLLNARVPTNKYNIRKITSTQFVASEGNLEFDLAYITSTGGAYTYIYDYEITLYDQTLDEEYIYNINMSSEGVSLENNKVTYTLPSKITTILGEEHTIDNSHSFTIKLKALSSTQYVINGSYYKTDGVDYTMQFVRSNGVSDVRIENGELRWKVLDLFNYTMSRIDLAFVDSNSQIQHISFDTYGDRVNDENGEYLYHSHTFTDGLYPIPSTGAQTYINPSIEYTISISTIGTTGSNNAIISSAYSQGLSSYRLSSVISSSITAVDGVLTWSAVPDAVSYEVTLTKNGESYNFVTTNTSLDFNAVADSSNNYLTAGEYSVYIRAIGDTSITARQASATSTFIKLDQVENIRIDETDSSYITWDAVNNADGYFVTFTYGNNVTTSVLVENDTKVLVPDGVSGVFEVSVVARGIGLTRVFNGEAGNFVSSTSRPSAVSGLNYDYDNQHYYWSVASDFLSSDSFRISYSMYEYIASASASNGSVVSDEITQHTITISASSCPYYEAEEVRYYYFKPTVLGIYSNFNVQVVRNNSNNSATSSYGEVDYNLYSYGSGTSENPYRIKNATHLLNISYNESAEYELLESINLSGINFSDRLDRFNAIIANNFSGVINGEGNVIYGFNNIELTNITNFALFNNLDGAEINDLSIGLNDTPSYISISFALNSANMINLSVLAVNANNSTINNVDVNSFNISLIDSSSAQNVALSGNIYASGLVASLTNSEIIDSNSNISFDFDISFTSTQVYVGGMVATSTSSSITSTTATFNSNLTLSQRNSNNSFNYVGGVTGLFSGEEARSSTISNAIANVNFTNIYANRIGGIVGAVTQGRISNSVSTGVITNQALNKNMSMGGIAGIIQSAIVENSGCEITFNLRVTNSSTTEIYIGALAGNITTTNNITTTINDCYANFACLNGATTIGSGGIVNMGIYGQNRSNIPINNWTTTG